MKIYTNGRFIRLREKVKNAEELAFSINRSRAYVMKIFKDGMFTDTEQILILRYLGIEDTKENRKEYFT